MSEDRFLGLKLKAERTGTQLDELYAEILAFLNEKPYIPAAEFSASKREVTARAVIRGTPNPMWGVRIGEIVHNLRSALDHITRDLVILNTGSPPATRQNQFLIFETEAGFNSRGVPKFLKDVGNDAIDLIRSEQPFMTREGAETPLW